jgi:hypothetical protein
MGLGSGSVHVFGIRLPNMHTETYDEISGYSYPGDVVLEDRPATLHAL